MMKTRFLHISVAKRPSKSTGLINLYNLEHDCADRTIRIARRDVSKMANKSLQRCRLDISKLPLAHRQTTALTTLQAGRL